MTVTVRPGRYATAECTYIHSVFRKRREARAGVYLRG